VLLPLWGLWGFSWFTLKGMEGWLERVPRDYGIHLYKQQVDGQLELFARVIDLFEKGEFRSRLAYLDQNYQRGEIGQMAALFGLSPNVMLLDRRSFTILYPSRPSGPLAPILEDAQARAALVRSLQRMAGGGEKEGFVSLPESGPGSQAAGRDWYLSVAYSGGDLLCVLLVPEQAMTRSAQALEAVQGARTRDRMHRYLRTTVPLLLLASLLIVWLSARIAARDERGESEKVS